jgi:hypothetical protein
LSVIIGAWHGHVTLRFFSGSAATLP